MVIISPKQTAAKSGAGLLGVAFSFQKPFRKLHQNPSRPCFIEFALQEEQLTITDDRGPSRLLDPSLPEPATYPYTAYRNARPWAWNGLLEFLACTDKP
jgi:hypothetical protein